MTLTFLLCLGFLCAEPPEDGVDEPAEPEFLPEPREVDGFA